MEGGRVREAATDPAAAVAVMGQDAASVALGRDIVSTAEPNAVSVADNPDTAPPVTESVASKETQWPKTASPRGGTT